MLITLNADPSPREYAEFIQKLSDPVVKTVLLISPYEWYPPVMSDFGSLKFLERLQNFTKRHDFKLESIVGMDSLTATPYDNPYMTMHHWPTFWMSYFYYTYPLKNKVSVSTNEKLFLLMNGKPYDHRCQTMELLARYGLLEKNIQLVAATGTLKYGYASWNNFDTKYKFKFWNPDILKLDVNFGKQEYLTKIPEQFDKVFMNLVSESSMTSYAITEKTAKPLLLEKPFLSIACPGFHTTFLKSLGFELYDEVFDYEFDTIENTQQRIEAIIKMMKPMSVLKKQDFDQLYDKLKNKLIYNRQRFIQLATDMQYWPQVLLDQCNSGAVTDSNIANMYTYFKSK